MPWKWMFSFCLFAALAAGRAQAFDIALGGKPLAAVYLASDEPAPAPLDIQKLNARRMTHADRQPLLLAAALDDLQVYVKRMSGADLEFRRADSPEAIHYPAIVVGRLARLAGIAPPDSQTGEGFTLKITPEAIHVAGTSPAGDAYGIYELLARLGCVWVMPGAAGEAIPPLRDRLSVSETETSQVPSFPIRSPWYSGGRGIILDNEAREYAQWKMRNKLQTHRGIHPLQMHGGHVWDSLTRRRYKAEFEADPEMLALVRQPDGSFRRQGPQIETTNPKVVDLMERYVRELFAENNWPRDMEVNVGVGPADGHGYSESPETMMLGSGRVDPTSGAPDLIDLMVLLCNQLLERLEKDFPNLHLGFYLYSWHGDFPVRYAPHPKIAVVVADISFSRLHSTAGGKSRSREYYRNVLEPWGELGRKQGNPIIFRGYNWNLADNILPTTKIGIWGEDIPFYHRLGALGMDNESVKAWAVNGPADWLEARLLWNAELPWREEFAAYCRSAFGQAAPFMEQYYLALAERQSAGGIEAGSYFGVALLHDDGFVASQQGWLDKAAEAAKDDAPAAERVRIASIPLETMRRFQAFRRAYLDFDFTKAEAEFNALKEQLRDEIGKNGFTVCRTGMGYLDRFFGSFLEKGKQCSTGEARIEYRVPDVLPVMLDPLDAGESLGFYRSDLRDDGFIHLKTTGATWDMQGMDSFVRGAVWYRIRFALPESAKGREIGFFLGGGDGQFQLWLNNVKVAESIGTLRPFVYDLTPFVEHGGENALTVKVFRQARNELGVGGLMMPSFVFSADRVEETENRLILRERILPGGARERIDDAK